MKQYTLLVISGFLTFWKLPIIKKHETPYFMIPLLFMLLGVLLKNSSLFDVSGEGSAMHYFIMFIQAVKQLSV